MIYCVQEIILIKTNPADVNVICFHNTKLEFTRQRLSNCRLKYNSLVSVFSPYRAGESHKNKAWVYKLIRRCVPGKYNKQYSSKKLNEIFYVIFSGAGVRVTCFWHLNLLQWKDSKREISTKSVTVF